MIVMGDGRLASLTPDREVELKRQPRQVDICFVFDTTGSMNDKIDGLVSCTVDFVQELARLGLDWRVTAVPFGDLTVPSDRIVTDLPFVTTPEAGAQLLRALPRFSGGSNQGESSLDAMLAALAKPFRKKAVKVLVLLTDEPGLEGPQVTTRGVSDRLRTAEVVCFVASPDLQYYRAWANENGGKWYQIAASMDTGHLLDLLKSLVREVATVAQAVHELGGGSVRAYLELGSGSGRHPRPRPS
jgi:hypothetical protein